MLNNTPATNNFTWSVDSLFEVADSGTSEPNTNNTVYTENPALLVVKAEMRREFRLELERTRASLREEFCRLLQTAQTTTHTETNKGVPLPFPLR